MTRDPDGTVDLSAKTKDDVEKPRPWPSTDKSSGSGTGYANDHMGPLKCGGADVPSKMQWQTEAAAKAKDKTE